MQGDITESERAILAERARLLAMPEPVFTQISSKAYLTFALGTEIYAIDTTYVVHTLLNCQIEALPKMPEFFAGVTLFRGRVLSVIDPRPLLNISQEKLVKELAFIECCGMTIGFLVERILQVEASDDQGVEEHAPEDPVAQKLIKRTFSTGVYELNCEAMVALLKERMEMQTAPHE